MLDDLGAPEELIRMAIMMPETHPTSFKKGKPFSSSQIIAPPETEIMFNLSSEAAYKYSLPAFADFGCDPIQRTSNIMQTNALYLETSTKRYEISKESGSDKEETYRLAEVLDPFGKNSEFMAQTSVPLSGEHVKVRVD